MYDRAPRVLVATAPTNSTPSTIGPGVYWQDSKEIRNGFAPFLSLSKRESFLTINEQVAVAPGPGQYSLNEGTTEKVKGGSTLKNRSERFGLSSSVAPGPGTYSIRSTLPKKKPEHRQPIYTATTRTKKTVRPRVIYSRMKTAPSIPFPGQSYGYEEDDYGQLVAKVLPEKKDSAIGPTHYDVPCVEDNKVSKKYKGIHFSKFKSQRHQFKGKDGPGPGEYNPKHHYTDNSVTVPKPSALLPRYHQLIPHLEEKKGVPGPGKYKIPSQFVDSVGPLDSSPMAQPPFGCSQQRFVVSYPQSPASTKYNNPRTAFDSLKRITGLTKSPFGQTSARFRTDKKALEVPGPGTYNNNKAVSLAHQAMKKAATPGLKHNAFGSTSVRTVPLTKKDEQDLPGPAMYQETVEVPQSPNPKQAQGTSAFKSSIQRLPSPPPIVKDIPPPGAYEVVESYYKTHDRNETKRPTANSAFMSSSIRFAPPRNIQLKETDPLNPGPAEYDPGTKSCVGMNQNGLLCSKEDRFKAVPASTLGPGTYEFNKAQMDTVLKGTFNATLNNPLSSHGSPLGGVDLASQTYRSPTIATGGHVMPTKQTIVLSGN